MAFTPDGIAPPGIPLLGCSPPPPWWDTERSLGGLYQLYQLTKQCRKLKVTIDVCMHIQCHTYIHTYSPATVDRWHCFQRWQCRKLMCRCSAWDWLLGVYNCCCMWLKVMLLCLLIVNSQEENMIFAESPLFKLLNCVAPIILIMSTVLNADKNKLNISSSWIIFWPGVCAVFLLQIMWLVLKFFLLATELSVVIFGLLFG